jgi:hypothetical protein
MRRMLILTAAVSFAVVACSMQLAATTYTVSPDGLGDFPTIQAAVDSAGFGDFIVLTDGTFTGEGNRDIVVPSETFVLQSQSGDPTTCIIDCGGSARDEHRAFHFTSEGEGFATISGIGIVNGYVSTHGGGIWVDGASPSIVNCIVAMCEAGTAGRGGGLYVDAGSPNISQCTFASNIAAYGGGIAIWNGTGTYQQTIVNDNEAGQVGGGIYAQTNGYTLVHLCEITSNSAYRAGGVRWAGAGGDPALSYSIIARNEATGDHSGGVWLQAGLITQCSIIENSAAAEGGGVYCGAGTGGIYASIVAFSEDGEGIAADDTYAPTVSCCDVYGNADGEYDATVGDQTGADGNFSLDPSFCGMVTADYTLDSSSPCLPGGNDCGFLIGALDQGCDTPVERTSWGALKAMWR